MRKQKPRLPIKPIIFLTLILLGILFIGYLGRAFKNLYYFQVKEIIASDGSRLEGFSYLKGKNIFNVDLKKEADYILGFYPGYKQIRLVRVLPDRLVLDFVKRNPFGLVKLYRQFLVGDDLVLFDNPGGIKELDLPVISGLETKIFGPKAGKKYDLTELRLAINIIKEAGKNKTLKDYKIKRVDVASPGNAAFFIAMPLEVGAGNVEGQSAAFPVILEVRIGQDDIRTRIDTLSKLIPQIKDELNTIKYIDLRFKDPLIKPRTEDREKPR